MARPIKKIKRDIVIKFRVDANFLQALEICKGDSYIQSRITTDQSKMIRYMMAKQMMASVIRMENWKKLETLLHDDLD